MFKNAQKIAAPAKAPKKSAKVDVEIAGLEQFAMVDALYKSLEAIKDTMRADILAAALPRFLAHIKEKHSKPDSFRGVEHGASASIEFRKKASNIALNEAQVAMLRAADIEPLKVVKVPALFAVAPKYAGDAELLGKAEAALVAAGMPDDLIVLQEEQAIYVVSDETMTAVCAHQGDAVAELVAAVATLGVKSKLQTTNMARILEFVRGLLVAPMFGEAANEAQAATSKKAAA